MEVAAEKAAPKTMLVALPANDTHSMELNDLIKEKEDLNVLMITVCRDDDFEASEQILNRLQQIEEALEEISRCEYKMARDKMMA